MTEQGLVQAQDLKVIVVGGGGREHAICWALAKSKKVKSIIAKK